ncbi:MAG: ATP-dependent sacrificial sulfur transferase LarE [Firmicutes bacterium]|nr:ATP-dependent sacrificial sulfur transferase LarE [Bacillota bacterium]
MDTALQEKYRQLGSILAPMKRVLVAFSGGVDSAVLVAACVEVLGPAQVLAVTSASESVPKREVAYAKQLASDIGVAHRVIDTRELDNEDYARNDLNRCYFCKQTLFSDLLDVAREEGMAYTLYGAILDDLGDFRPGMRAARELGIRGPLAEAQFVKADVRALAEHFGLSVAHKPASACLSSRLAYGERVTAGALSQVERAEDFLKDLGFAQVRVRHHGDHARIEVPVQEIAKVAGRAEEIHAFLHALGYAFVSLDLAGYRSGSMNVPATGTAS